MSVPALAMGPCEDWITGDDVADCCGANSDDIGPTLFDQVAREAQEILFEVSGRIFTGLCERTVRPCRDGCGCWGPRSSGLGPWAWTFGGHMWGWECETGQRCGCNPLSRIRLPGYPVRDILSVTIDGADLPAIDDDGAPNWRLDGGRWLVRMDSPSSGRRAWPGCQNLALDATEAGTFEVSYVHGTDPPGVAVRAAAELACEMYRQCPGGDGECRLPAQTTRVTRQGVTVDRKALTMWIDPKKGGTGLPAVDLFLGTYWRGVGGRRPAVWSPDVEQHARRVGS